MPVSPPVLFLLFFYLTSGLSIDVARTEVAASTRTERQIRHTAWTRDATLGEKRQDCRPGWLPLVLGCFLLFATWLANCTLLGGILQTLTSPHVVPVSYYFVGSQAIAALLHATLNLPPGLVALLFAFDYSLIPTFDNLSLTVDVCLRRSSSWIFVVADVPPAVLGSNFLSESDLLVDRQRSRLLDRTTDDGIHPAANGIVECSHHQLKTALRATEDPANWSEYLPLWLFDISSALKSDQDCGAAELMFDTTLQLPEETVIPTSCGADENLNNFVHRLWQFMRTLSPVPPRTPPTESYLEECLAKCTHVFVWCDRVRKPLRPPYEGLSHALSENAHNRRTPRGDKEGVVSVDRVEAAVAGEPSDLSQGQDCADSPPYASPPSLHHAPLHLLPHGPLSKPSPFPLHITALTLTLPM
ncbi:hypothetical protein SprV_0100092300 [Sparganum proliferum]